MSKVLSYLQFADGVPLWVNGRGNKLKLQETLKTTPQMLTDLSAARGVFDTLDEFESQVAAANAFLEERGYETLQTDYFGDLLVPSDTPGVHHVVGFNRLKEQELHGSSPAQPLIAFMQDHLSMSISSLIQSVKQYGEWRIEGQSFSVSNTRESPQMKLLFFFHRSIWKFYPMVPAALVDELRWVLDNINSAQLTFLWDEWNSVDSWHNMLRSGADVVWCLSHGRLVQGEPTICAGTDPFGRPTETMGSSFIRDVINGAERKPRFVLLYACHSLQSSALADAFLANESSGAVIGWSEKTPALSETVDRVCRALVSKGREEGENISQSLQRVRDTKLVPLEVLGHPVDLQLQGNPNVKWWSKP